MAAAGGDYKRTPVIDIYVYASAPSGRNSNFPSASTSAYCAKQGLTNPSWCVAVGLLSAQQAKGNQSIADKGRPLQHITQLLHSPARGTVVAQAGENVVSKTQHRVRTGPTIKPTILAEPLPCHNYIRTTESQFPDMAHA